MGCRWGGLWLGRLLEAGVLFCEREGGEAGGGGLGWVGEAGGGG